MFSALLKGSIFVIGIVIIGILEPRTVLPSCHSGLEATVPVYQFPEWPHIEAYTDYRDLYLPCLTAPFLAGNGLYHLGSVGIVYNYPPLFLYLFAGFAAIANLIWFPAIPLVLFDVLTVIPLYCIAKEFFFLGQEEGRRAKLAFVVALFWAANPINLFYNDLMWLNTAPTTFFLVLALYLFLKQRWFYSSLALAISTGFKQISIILFPILLIFLWRTAGFSKKLGLYVFTYIAAMILISTPYIFNDSQNYFWSLNFPVFGIPSNVSSQAPSFSESLSDPVRITTFLGYLSQTLANFVSISYVYLNYVVAGALILLLGYLIYSSFYEPKTNREVGLMGSGSTNTESFRAPRFKRLKLKRSFDANEILVFCLAGLLIFLAFFGRGVYKYYFASITPLGIPLFRNKYGSVTFAVISVVLLLAPREVTPWMAVLLLTLVPQMLQP